MSQVARVNLSSGAQVLVEVRSAVDERDVSDRPLRAKFTEVLGDIVDMCKDFDQALQAIAPDKASVKFGLNLAAETKGLVAIVAKASAEANFEVQLEWARAKPPG